MQDQKRNWSRVTETRVSGNGSIDVPTEDNKLVYGRI